MTKSSNNVVYIDCLEKEQKQLLEQTFREHEGALRRFLQMRLVSPADQDDLIQELFLKLTRVEDLAGRLDDGSGSTRHYLISIISNLLIDKQRQSRRRHAGNHDSYEDDVIQTRRFSPEPSAVALEGIQQTIELLKTVKPLQRQVFVLNRFKNQSYRKIALDMSLSETTVERYIATVLSKLQKGLNNG
jgi:RNA polymerase sigma factor (sigma-70 family)